MADNLKIWETFDDIDPKYTKQITGKDYKGTSPNAHYVIKCLTELFGPVGVGFGWEVVAEGIEKFGDTSIHWCRISFWHTSRENTFQSYGQTKMAYMTRSQNAYLKVDEDAPKKSLTDAITKSAAQIGIAANIFLGRWDDNKYIEEVAKEYRQKESAKTPPKLVTQEQAEILKGLADKAGSDRGAIFQHYKLEGDKWEDLPQDLFEKTRKGMQGKINIMEVENTQ